MELLKILEMMATGTAFNAVLAVLGFVAFWGLLRVFNVLNGYTIPEFIGDCRDSKNYVPIAMLFASQSLSTAILLGLIIS